MKPPIFQDVVDLYQNSNKQSVTLDQQKDDLFKSIMMVIKEVDGIDDRNLIREWIESVPANYIQLLTNNIMQVSNWGPDFNAKLLCKDCGKEIEVATPINPLAFFM
jgi:hypothetical protein